MGVIFGGGNSSVFGSTGAGGVLAKLTALMAVIFVITSLSYTYVSSSHPVKESVILNVQIEDQGKPSEPVPTATEPTKPEDAVKPENRAASGTPVEKASQPEATQGNPAASGK